MAYHQLFYHLIWSTLNRQPLLTAQTEPIIYAFLRAKAIGLEAVLFALNGTADHVHVVVSIPPKIAVAKFIGQVKAVASTKFNKSRPDDPPFFWQDEYGAFSFDAKRLPNYIAYVSRQKEHHAQGTTIPVLERTDDNKPGIMREATTFYTVEETNWWRELEALSGHNDV